jgi:hypothetical protein
MGLFLGPWGAKADQAAADIAPTIREIRAGGAMSLRQIAAELDRRGIPTPRGRKLTATAVKRTVERANALETPGR